ncbi:hypothetical protein BMS3Abin17_00569 [archaeon BMS3Abin17]|nr:hypothetical protein BMS3Abin17_00569 [archaeon BMS3Abin17]
MDKLTYWIVTVIGVLLALPLLSVTALQGTITDWLIALGVLVIGVKGLLGK